MLDRLAVALDRHPGRCDGGGVERGKRGPQAERAEHDGDGGVADNGEGTVVGDGTVVREGYCCRGRRDGGHGLLLSTFGSGVCCNSVVALQLCWRAQLGAPQVFGTNPLATRDVAANATWD